MTTADDGVLGSPWRVVPHRLAELWSQAFHRAWEQPSIRIDIACPNCGVTALRELGASDAHRIMGVVTAYLSAHDDL